MKKHLVFILLLIFAFPLIGFAQPPGPSTVKKVQNLDNCPSGKVCVDTAGGLKAGSATIGQTSPTTIDDSGVETPAIIVGEPISSVEESANWVVYDATQTIIGQIQFVCTDITDGSQDCAWKFFFHDGRGAHIAINRSDAIRGGPV